MENRVVALAVLENLIHWPLAHGSGSVAPPTPSHAGDDSEDDTVYDCTATSRDADDLNCEPRQRRMDRCRAVLLLPHLCQKLGGRWVESEVVPYLLRCLEEDDAQLSLVTGLALLGVTLPRCSPATAAVTAASPTSDAAGKATPSPTTTTTAVAASGVNTYKAFLSIEEVQPVCLLLAASGTEETRAFAAQVVLPHLYFGIGLERDTTLESWDVKYVPLSVLHADTLTSDNSTGGSGSGGDSAAAASVASALDAGVAEEGCGVDAVATSSFVSAVRQQLVRQRQQEERRQRAQQQQQQQVVLSATERDALGRSTSIPGVTTKDSTTSASAAAPVSRVRVSPPSEEEVRLRCQALALEDEAMQFLYHGAYDSLTGPWGFTGDRLAALSLGSQALPSSSTAGEGRHNGEGRISSSSSEGHGASVSMVVGSSFRGFRVHARRLRGSQVLRDLPPSSLRTLSQADMELYGASYAADDTRCDGSARDNFFSVNVRARALVSDLVRWMEAVTPAAHESAAATATANTPTSPDSPTPSTSTSAQAATTAAAAPLLFSARHTLCLYDYVSHDGRKEVLRRRWQALLKLLQNLLESPYPGPVAVALELISGFLYALQATLMEAEGFLQRGGQRTGAEGMSSSPSSPDTTSALTGDGKSTSGVAAEEALWGIGAPTTPLLTTAQLQSFVSRYTRRHVAYCVAAAVTTRPIAVPPALHDASTDAEAWRAPTEALARLLRAALPVAQKALTDLLFRHHLFVRVKVAPTTAAGGEGVAFVQMGAGPCEARVQALSAWDSCFAPSARKTGGGGGCLMPDDASFLLPATAADDDDEDGGGAAVLSRTVWLPGILNAYSNFRVHRLVRRTLLRALPLCVDYTASPCSTTKTTTTATASPLFSLCAVCPILLQVLVPPRTFVGQLQVLHAAARLCKDGAASINAGPARLHTDPATGAACPTLKSAVPALWAAMTAPGSILSAGETTAKLQGQETPASLDFDLLEAALEAVQRLTAEAAVRFAADTAATEGRKSTATTRTSSAVSAAQTLSMHAVCAQLFTLLSACVWWVPRYTGWKARWLIAQRLPHLLSTFCYLLASLRETPLSVMWLLCTLQLLTSVWTCAGGFGTAPLGDLTDDEDVEVRCVAARCAAGVFRRVAEAVLRVSAAAAAAATSFALSNRKPPSFLPPMVLPALSEPLVELLDATAQCVLVAAKDVDSRVRCGSAEALVVLSHTLSMLVAAEAKAKPLTSTLAGDGSGKKVWLRYLRSNTNALLALMSDEMPIVQLTLVSEVAELLLMYRGPSGSMRKKRDGLLESAEGQDEDDDADDPLDARSADQVQHEALLNCLRQLAQHDQWRLREEYARLLAHLCGRLLQLGVVTPPGGAGKVGHTHPLYQLARTELLTLLVDVLFDKVKAVRDAALDAVERMSLRLAAAARQRNNSLQQEGSTPLGLSGGGGAGGLGGVHTGRDGGAGGGRTFAAVIRAAGSAALTSGSSSSSSTPNANTFVDDVLWPRIADCEKAWQTYLSRSALLHIALRLRVDKTSVLLPLLDQLARDPVLNVRLVVAKIILEVLLRSAPEADTFAIPVKAADGGAGEASGGGVSSSSSSYRPELPSGTVPYRILMNKPHYLVARKDGLDAVLPPLQFTEEERTGVVLGILRQLLKDANSDVRDEAAKALKVCF